eukprot:gnl/Dysnectes_brevis/2144_a2494_1632.p1 GENE.gnl/Dysnectes_brevis/2144_a2494_1632~~gnl/Dysnectes_brevis/2144_a2494_1632.p1  ORF type:complete len:951 (+),score=391.19 gnl/Dysnectes_brevis/2144_a2494_1632:147-2999(+)
MPHPAPELEDTTISCRSTACTRCERTECAVRKESPTHTSLKGNWDPVPMWTDGEIIAEARRCLYCAEPRCTKSCSANLDVKHMVHAAGEHNIYHGVKAILDSNPLGLSTAFLCQCEELCQRGCTLANTAVGSIKTQQIQRWLLEKFRVLNIAQEIKPGTPTLGSIAVIGAGPSGLSAATFLARFGYQVTIIEAAPRAGGLLVSELPEWRLPLACVDFEIRMVKELGVKFRFKSRFGVDVTLESLGEEGFQAVFLGCGKPEEVPIPFPTGAVTRGVMNSHQFLRAVNLATKLHVPGAEAPDLTGKRVVIVGAGDTALDCAQTAYRLGAEHVTVSFRKQVSDMRATKIRLAEAIAEGAELMPLVEPTALQGSGDLSGVVFRVNKKNREGRYVPTGLQYELEADLLVLCLGARPSSLVPDHPVDPDTNRLQGELPVPTFAGGDGNSSVSVVEAANDGRCAAVHIHSALTGVPVEDIVIPGFHTAVDNVSLTTDFCGMHLENPFGPSSAPITATKEHIARAYDAGFGFSLTKTFCLTKDVGLNNHVRIVRINPFEVSSTSYQNICMITEHPFDYWIQTIKELRAEYPQKGLVASIMCMDSKEDWQTAAIAVREALGGGANVGIELNFSCPNECHGCSADGGDSHAGGYAASNAMAMAIGTDPIAVERCTRYVTDVVTDIPVFAKLTPNTAIIEHLASAALRGGATGVTAINTVNGIARVFPSGNPWPRVGKECRVLSGGLSGDQVLPIALRHVNHVLRHNPGIPIMGSGGVRSALTAIQHLYAGSGIVQVCSAVQRFSYEIVSEMCSGLQFLLYCRSRPELRRHLLKGYGEEALMPELIDDGEVRPVESVNAIIGNLSKHMCERGELEGAEKWRVRAEIEPAQCIECGKCATSCRDNGPSAIYRGEDGKYVIDPSVCIGCAMCSMCPTGAITYKELPGLDFLTPEERALVPHGF